MNEEDEEINKDIHLLQKKITEVTEHIKSLGFRKTKKTLEISSESRYIDQLMED